jgi:hypothetical protein
VRGTLPRLSGSWFLGHWTIETVQMPAESTVGARDDRTIGCRCSAMTLVTEDGISLAVLQFEVIWGFIITRAIPRIL